MFGPLLKQYEGIDLHVPPEPGDVQFVYHTYYGFLVFAIQNEHRVSCPSDQALVLLGRFLRFNLTWGMFAYGIVVIPLLAYGNYLAQKRSIKKQIQRQQCSGGAPSHPSFRHVERRRSEREEADAKPQLLHDKLVAAILRGDCKRAEKLLQQGADINFAGWAGIPSLFTAVSNSNVEAVQWMIDAGAALDAEHYGTTLLEKARSMITTIGWRPDLPLSPDRREYYESWHIRAVEVLRLLESAGAT